MKKYKLLLFTGYIYGESMDQFTFSGKIKYFMETQKDLMKSPLKNLHRIKSWYLDKIDTLAFAYGSIFVDILGNVTPDKPIFYTDLFLQVY